MSDTSLNNRPLFLFFFFAPSTVHLPTCPSLILSPLPVWVSTANCLPDRQAGSHQTPVGPRRNYSKRCRIHTKEHNTDTPRAGWLPLTAADGNHTLFQRILRDIKLSQNQVSNYMRTRTFLLHQGGVESSQRYLAETSLELTTQTECMIYGR